MSKPLLHGVFAGASFLFLSFTATLGAPAGGELVFADDFKGQLGAGWSWLREDPPNWRIGPEGLEVRVQPGNMWGAANNARNVLVRDLPSPDAGPVEVSVTVSNSPTGQWEQVNLVWYYADSHMVKLGQELVTGRFSLVMGREEGDRARTVAIIPLDALTVELRFQAWQNRIRGQFRTAPWADWRDVGECDLPVKGGPKASLQFYQGPPGAPQWARVTRFAVRRLPTEAVDWPRKRATEKVIRAASPDAAAIDLGQKFKLANEPGEFGRGATGDFEQRLFLNQDGSYGWFWDRRSTSSKKPISSGASLGGAGLDPAAAGAFPVLGLAEIKSLELELDAVTRLEGDHGEHNLAAVVWLRSGASQAGPATEELVIWFDWYGPASTVQSLNDGYRDYGYVPPPSPAGEQLRRQHYRIKGFRGAPPRINLKAFLDDAAGRGLGASCQVLGVWFGNEIWDNSRGGTLVTRLDCLLNGQRYSSVPRKP